MNKRRFTVLVLLGVMALAVMPAQAAPTVTFVAGSSTCASVGSTGIAFTVNDPAVGVDIEADLPGVPGATLHVTGVERKKFDFSVEGALIQDVIVKGSGANWYDYGATPVSSDVDLMIPNGNKLNVIHFCYGAIPNAAPVAVDDAAGVLSGGSVLIDVLANDTDADNDTLTIDSFTQPAIGEVTASGGGLMYSRVGGAVGDTDAFTYTISDGNGETDTATVTVTVFEGVLPCDETVTASDETSGISALFTRLVVGPCEESKLYTINLEPSLGDNGEIEFLIDPSFTEEAEYVGKLTFARFEPANPNSQTFVWDLDNPGGTLTAADWCDSATFDVDGNLTSAVPPTGEDGCVASQLTISVGAGEAQTTWWVYFKFDLKTRG